ncbi:MAG: response regulator transcription factor [Solirubrobacteraceae bacterium]|nr:response regulator transcription factor [Solirubrobacteraceae bacterium]
MLVDDDELVRRGLRLILSSDPALDVVAEAEDGDVALRRAAHHRPDVVLMDVRMPHMDGITATRELIAHVPDASVLILTTFEEDEYVLGALRAGASGFLLKRSTPEELLRAVHVVADGDALLSPTVTRRVIERFVKEPAVSAAAEPGLAELTPRELEVFLLIARGRSNREIGAELTVEETTVKSHVRNVLMKLGARDRIQAVILAYEYGAISPGEHPSR